MKILKCYLAFTQKSYRLVMLIILPFILVAGMCILCYFTKWPGIFWWVWLLLIWPLMAIIGDHFIGLYRIRENGLEYVKSSGKGVQFVKKAVAGDCIQKFLWTALIYSGGYALLYLLDVGNPITAQSMTPVLYTCLTVIFYGYGSILLCTILSRFFLNFSTRLLCAYGAVFLSFIFWLLTVNVAPAVNLAVAFVYVLAVCGANGYVINKKMGEMYYDE
ncbi:MAG: hypothetical protein LUH19_04080 [Lachnospiraceae bacterium]|nr:hypothetical protein [Lachnospiraceae bacterium]